MDNPNNGIVADLVESQAGSAIRRYQGNLLAVRKAIESGWIPKGDEPGLNEHLDALRNYLAATGVTEDDAILLLFALTVPGMQRGIVPPLLVLEPNRNGLSERRKREAAGLVSRLSEVLSLARAFLVGLSQSTSLALRELAVIVSTPPEDDPSPWLAKIRSLTPKESREVAAMVLHCLENRAKPVRDLGLDLLHSLACFRFEPLGTEIRRSLRGKAIYWPANLYRDTGDAETNALLALLKDANDSLSVNHLLQCVAWTRSEAAVASFREN